MLLKNTGVKRWQSGPGCRDPPGQIGWHFTAYIFKRGWQVAEKGGLISILHRDPKDPNCGKASAAWTLMTANEESVLFPQCAALGVNVKGPYEQLPKAIAFLQQSAREQGFRDDGNVRFVYLTSPQSHLSPE